MGEREDGTPLETCIAKEAEAGRSKRNAQSLTGKAGLAVKVLSDTVATEGKELPRASGFPSALGRYGVTKKRWREECVGAGYACPIIPTTPGEWRKGLWKPQSKRAPFPAVAIWFGLSEMTDSD
jgi:hypothetical protein